tara:strand:+ start:131 stop:286 length:156 start_codon:yes stop_codon:yes gene_type:complete
MFLNRDPELTGEIAGYQQAVKVQVKSFKGGDCPLAHFIAPMGYRLIISTII